MEHKIISRAALATQRGIGKITLLVFGTILAALVYSGYKILPFYYCYFEITNQFEQVIRVASEYNDREIREKLWYHIKKLELPVEPDDLKIQREAGKMRISMPYEEIFYVTWQGKDYDIYKFEFQAYAEGAY
ncbi:MAG: hypothetical protein J0M12_06180 [Deltaproteobacteria bacterium]|nr:hypothetical protein [Deltaproteobacteria bacterium]